MKTCPKCGAKMAADVNFCTSCGADIRNVEVKAETQASEQEVKTDVKPEPTRTSTQAENTGVAGEHTQAKPEQPNDQENNGSTTGNATGNGFSQAIREFDAHNMWNWFVNSWKHPFAEQHANKWYGWITLIAEDILFGLGLFIGGQRAVNSTIGYVDSYSRISFGVVFELMIFIALAQLAWIGSAYLAYKVIYGHSKDFLQLTNHVVQTSNLSAIFMVVFFLFMVLMGPAGVFISGLMVSLAVTFFSMALTIVVLGDPNPVHDKFYGYLLFIVLQFITGVILFMLISGTIASQIGSSFF